MMGSRSVLIATFWLCVGALWCERVQGAAPLNFDKLFPQSPMQIMLESCMRIEHELLWCATRDHVDESEAEDLVDLVVGRLYHVRACAQEVADCHLPLHEEDVTYLFSLLETIQETYTKLMKTSLPAYGKHALALLSDIRSVFDAFVG
jgi:hypothetical protein